MVTGYIWPCLPQGDCQWPWARRREVARGLERARMLRGQAVAKRNQELLGRWSGDAAAWEVEVAMLSGQSWRLRIGADATAGEVKAHLSSLSQVPVSEMALISGASKIADEVLLSTKAMQTGCPCLQLHMLRVRRRRALSGSLDSTLRLWDLDSGACISTLRGHGDAITSIAVDWPSRRVLSGSHDCRLKLWDLDHGICVMTLRSLGHPAFCLAVDWLSARAASGSWDQTVRLWDLDRGVQEATLSDHHGQISCVALEPAGAAGSSQRVVSGSDDGTLKVWTVQGRGSPDKADLPEGALDATVTMTMQGHAGRVMGVAVDWRAQRALSGAQDAGLRLWDLTSSACLARLEGHFDAISHIAMNWREQKAFTGSWDSRLKVWDLSSMVCVAELQQQEGGVTCAAVDWDANQALSGSGSSDHAVRLWDLSRGECIKVFWGHDDAVNCLVMESHVAEQ